MLIGSPQHKLPEPPSSSSTFPAAPLILEIHQLDWLVEMHMRHNAKVYAPKLGMGLPRDHIGTLNEHYPRWVDNRCIAEKLRNEMQTQLLTSVVISRKAFQKYDSNGDRNMIRHLAPVNYDRYTQILDVGAGRGYWGRSSEFACLILLTTRRALQLNVR